MNNNKTFLIKPEMIKLIKKYKKVFIGIFDYKEHPIIRLS